MRIRLVAGMMLLAVPAGASQPISESLTECAVIYDVSADRMKARRPERAARLAEAGEIFFAAAHGRAEAEGRADPAGYLAEVRLQKLEKWGDTTLLFMAVSETYRDWGEYCRALGRSQGLPPL